MWQTFTFWQIFISTFLIPLTLGIIANYLFSKLPIAKPNIAFSDKISKVKNKNGEWIYKIKIVNKSKVHITNIYISLVIATPNFRQAKNNLDGNVIFNLFIPFIPNKKKSDNYNRHAQRINIKRSLEDEWKDDNSFIF